MNQPILLLPPILLLGFWAWMFSDMTRNDALTPDERSAWMWWFLILNVFAAAWYFVTEYRRRG